MMNKKQSKQERHALIQKAKDREENPEKYGFPYIYIDIDGSARELTEEEKEYINTDFHPADGGRPYIKSYYESKTPDGKIHGFLLREHLPASITVKLASNNEQS